MKVFGWVMSVIGILMISGSWLMTTSVHHDASYSSLGGSQEASEILNIGLLQNQVMVLHTGSAFFLAGVVGLCFAALRDSMSLAGPAEAKTKEPGNWISLSPTSELVKVRSLKPSRE